MGHRFLFFSPYAAWSYHTHLEVTWAHSLRIRGHHVDFVACDGLFGACDLFRHILSKRDAGSCRHCQIQVLKLYKGLHNPTHWLGRFIPDGRRESIDAWAESVPADEILTAVWAGQPVGQWSQPLHSAISGARSWTRIIPKWWRCSGSRCAQPHWL